MIHLENNKVIQIGNQTLIHGECLAVMDKLIEQGIKVDAIITDPPYGTVKNIGNSIDIKHGMKNKTTWDTKINTKIMFEKCEKLLRMNGRLILFSQEPYSSELVTNTVSNLPFNYKNIWLKDHFANSLITKKSTVNYFEEILLFTRQYDLENMHPLRKYFDKIQNELGLSLKQINNKLGHRKIEHSFYTNSTQFELCTKSTYDEFVKVFEIDSLEYYKDYDYLCNIDATFNATFNLWEGNKFKSNVFNYKKDYKGFHPTQKPVLLMEDLIKTYTDEGNAVLDFTAGSFSTLVACRNTNRNGIGIELDENYYNIGVERVKNRVKVD